MGTISATTRKSNLPVVAAWGFMLLASILPEILLYKLVL